MDIKEFSDQFVEAKQFATDKQLEELIFKYVSQDEKIIPSLLAILSYERAEKSKILTEINSELSMGLVTLENFTNDKNQVNATIFNIKLFYKKWEEKIRCNFKTPGIR